MRRLLFAFLLSLPSLAFSAEPKASIVGPTSATVGEPVLLDLGGSASDTAYPLQVEVAGDGEFKPTLRLWYDATAKPGLAVLTAPRPGNYTVVVVAIGVPEKATKPVTRIAAWPVTINPIEPAPKPPGPGPEPVPPDPVPPGPTPVVGKLWGVLVLPDLPSVPEAALRTSLPLRSAFAAKNATFRSYLASEKEIQPAVWQAALAAAGGAPAVLWMTEAGKVVKTTPAATEAKILADLKALRGGN